MNKLQADRQTDRQPFTAFDLSALLIVSLSLFICPFPAATFNNDFKMKGKKENFAVAM